MKNKHFIQNLLGILIILRNLILRFQHCGTEFSRECLGNLHRLTNPRALDDHILNVVLLGELCKLGQQIPTQCTADASVLQLDELLGGLRDFVVLDEGGVDVQPWTESQ